jgi:hypothetical protein
VASVRIQSPKIPCILHRHLRLAVRRAVSGGRDSHRDRPTSSSWCFLLNHGTLRAGSAAPTFSPQETQLLNRGGRTNDCCAFVLVLLRVVKVVSSTSRGGDLVRRGCHRWFVVGCHSACSSSAGRLRPGRDHERNARMHSPAASTAQLLISLLTSAVKHRRYWQTK